MNAYGTIKRRRAHLIDGEHERHGDQRLFAAGQQRLLAHSLAARLRVHLHARLIRVGQVGKFQVTFAAGEQAREDFLEVLVDLVKRFQEAVAHLAVDGGHDALQRFLGSFEVVELHGDEVAAVFELAVFLHGHRVYRPEVLQTAVQLLGPLFCLLAVFGGGNLERDVQQHPVFLGNDLDRLLELGLIAQELGFFRDALAQLGEHGVQRLHAQAQDFQAAFRLAGNLQRLGQAVELFAQRIDLAVQV